MFWVRLGFDRVIRLFNERVFREFVCVECILWSFKVSLVCVGDYTFVSEGGLGGVV